LRFTFEGLLLKGLLLFFNFSCKFVLLEVVTVVESFIPSFSGGLKLEVHSN
jgi:hypothetical protein